MLRRGDRISRQEGFTLIELLIVLAIIGILAAIGMAGYLGMQERVRKMVVIASAATAESEVQAWLNSALKGASHGGLIEVDSNGSGEIDNLDANNSQLAALLVDGDLDAAYVNARRNQYNERSPWFPDQFMWINDVSAAGQVIVTGLNVYPYPIKIEGKDKLGNTLHIKTIYAD